MIVLGIICLIVGFILGIHILWIIGIILAVIGLALTVIPAVTHHTIAGRRTWY